MVEFVLKLNRKILEKEQDSLLQKSLKGGMSYPTFHKMATGDWDAITLRMLARYLAANGYTAEMLGNVKFSEIFTIEENNDAG